MQNAAIQTSHSPPRDTPAVRAVWQTPTLRVLGTLADLTATGSKNGKENKGNKTGNKP